MTKMTVERAREVLGLGDLELSGRYMRTSVDLVRAAFAERVKAIHPDTAGQTQLDDFKIIDLQLARACLLQLIESEACACQLCGGTGKVRGELGLRSCSACSGSGDKR